MNECKPDVHTQQLVYRMKPKKITKVKQKELMVVDRVCVSGCEKELETITEMRCNAKQTTARSCAHVHFTHFTHLLARFNYR